MHNSRLCETSGIVYNEQGRVAVGCSLKETSFLRRCTGVVGGGKGRKGGGERERNTPGENVRRTIRSKNEGPQLSDSYDVFSSRGHWFLDMPLNFSQDKKSYTQ